MMIVMEMRTERGEAWVKEAKKLGEFRVTGVYDKCKRHSYFLFFIFGWEEGWDVGRRIGVIYYSFSFIYLYKKSECHNVSSLVYG